MTLKELLQIIDEKFAESLITENDRVFCRQLAEQAQKSETRKKKVKKRKRKKDKS